ncbi:MAG: helix-turn-helix domain-containing protein [Planctomycetaceae bacterium]|nr:helix-turn-helix domain-containing protein [Planctomycetaceae bacterium]
MRSIYHDEQHESPIPRLALRPREAAESLGISEKGLWQITSPRGSIPCVRVGSRVMYFRHQLERWADEQAAQQATESEAVNAET